MSNTVNQHQTTADGRPGVQITFIALLSILPLIMIICNGKDALTIVSDSTQNGLQGPDGIVASSLAHTTPTLVARAKPLKFGIHDPGKVFDTDGNLKIRHIYISWVNFDAELLSEKLREFEIQGFEPMITIEPWQKNDSTTPLLPAITNGDYDDTIDRVALAIGVLTKPAFLIWGHEMDQDITIRYPWSSCSPKEYVKAYRYVADRIRKQVTVKHQWVWTGVMKEGSCEFWPGDSYADFIGMPIYSFPSWDQTTYGYIRDFNSTFSDKKRFVAELGKPIIITELGVNGSDDFESFWLHQAFIGLDRQPDLEAIVFFYAKDSDGVWGEKWDTPDWRVNPSLLIGLVDWKVGQAQSR